MKKGILFGVINTNYSWNHPVIVSETMVNAVNTALLEYHKIKGRGSIGIGIYKERKKPLYGLEKAIPAFL